MDSSCNSQLHQMAGKYDMKPACFFTLRLKIQKQTRFSGLWNYSTADKVSSVQHFEREGGGGDLAWSKSFIFGSIAN